MRVTFIKQALKDMEKIRLNKALAANVANLIEILETNPFKNPPPYEKLSGELSDKYSRRINRKHRMVYMINDDEVKILSMWSHYENL